MPETKPDIVAEALKRAPATNETRAATWDAYHESTTPDELGAKLKDLSLPTPIKAYLYDLKAGVQASPPWTIRHPAMAEVVKQGLNALPGIGGIVGGVAAAPETLGAGSIAGVALGVGAGRGVRDVATEALGLEPETSPVSKAGRIALDTGIAAVTPGAIEAVKTPVSTLTEAAKTFRNSLPKAVQVFLPHLEAMTPTAADAAILERPAWQSWKTPDGEKLHLSAIDVKRIKYIMEQGFKQAEAVKIVTDLKASGGMK